MEKYILWIFVIPAVLFSRNLNENLKPVSENKNKYHVSKSDLKKKFSQDKHLITSKSKIDRKYLGNQIKNASNTKGLLSDYKKVLERSPKIRESRERKSEKKQIERKRRRK